MELYHYIFHHKKNLNNLLPKAYSSNENTRKISRRIIKKNVQSYMNSY